MIATTMTNPETQPMASTESSISNQRLWVGRIMSGLPALFLLMDGSMKLYKPRVVVEATVQMGYPESAIIGLGAVLLLSTLLYLLPRTAILGAILLTGYLGGRRGLTSPRQRRVVQHHFPRTHRRSALGRSLVARSTLAGAHSGASAIGIFH